MNNDNEHISITFHNEARTIFFSVVNDFNKATENMDRRQSEFQYNQMKNQYVNTLKQQLEYLARKLMDQNQGSRQMKELEQTLSQNLKEYLHSFVNKTSLR